MVIEQKDTRFYLLCSLLLLVLGSNIVLYHSPLSTFVLTEDTKWVVLGSLIDFAIVSPLLLIAINRKKKFTMKRFITWMVVGFIAARFLIPAEYFQPFAFIPYIGIGIEAVLLLAELGLLFLFVRYFPKIRQQVRESEEGLLFTFPNAVEQTVKKHVLLQVLSAELMMFYYALGSWKKSVPTGGEYFTLHRNSSFIAFQVMMIHAIVIESIGLHWWLHEKSMVISIILLVLNVYSVFFFLGDIQAVRLNPVRLTKVGLSISLGLVKRMSIPIDQIQSIELEEIELEKKLDSKTTIEFVAKDFEKVYPHMILTLKEPHPATLLMGFQKNYTKVAIRLDDPKPFLQQLETYRSQ